MAVQQKVKTRKHTCPPHYFIIDSENVGHCRFCPAVRDFLELLGRKGVWVVAGRRGAKASKGKRGRKKKEVFDENSIVI